MNSLSTSLACAASLWPANFLFLFDRSGLNPSLNSKEANVCVGGQRPGCACGSLWASFRTGVLVAQRFAWAATARRRRRRVLSAAPRLWRQRYPNQSQQFRRFGFLGAPQSVLRLPALLHWSLVVRKVFLLLHCHCLDEFVRYNIDSSANKTGKVPNKVCDLSIALSEGRQPTWHECHEGCLSPTKTRVFDEDRSYLTLNSWLLLPPPPGYKSKTTQCQVTAFSEIP